MKSSIARGSIVRRIGETEIGVVAFLVETHAMVDYHTEKGGLESEFLPLATLAVVKAPKNKKAEPKAGGRVES